MPTNYLKSLCVYLALFFAVITSGHILPQTTLPVLKDDFIINSFGNKSCRKSSPVIASDSSGNFAVAWFDERNGVMFDLYVQFFNSRGERLGGNILVNDTTITAGVNTHAAPIISLNNKGECVVLWKMNDKTWYAQGFKDFGQKNGGIISCVADNYDVRNPSVAFNDDGAFLLVYDWFMDIGQSEMLQGRLFRPGESGYREITFNMGEYDRCWFNDYRQFDRVIVNKKNNYVVVWAGWYGNMKKVYMQEFSSSGLASGKAFLVSDVPLGNYLSFASVREAGGKYLVVWGLENDHSSKETIQGRIIGQDLTYGTQLLNLMDRKSLSSLYPFVCTDGKKEFMVGAVNRDAYTSEYLKVSPDGSFSADTTVLLDSSYSQAFPFAASVGLMKEDGFSAVLLCGKGKSTELLFKNYGLQANPSGQSIKVNLDEGSNDQAYPYITHNNFGDALVAWTDMPGTNWINNDDNYLQVFDANAVDIGENIRADSDNFDQLHLHATGALSDGSFLSLYAGPGDGSGAMYIQKIGRNGEKMGVLKKLWDEKPYSIGSGFHSPNYYLNVGRNDEIMICRYAASDDSGSADFWKFDKDYNLIYSKRNFLPGYSKVNARETRFALDEYNNILAVMNGRTNTGPPGEIYAQTFDSEGNATTGLMTIVSSGELKGSVNIWNAAFSGSNSFLITVTDNECTYIKRFYLKDRLYSFTDKYFYGNYYSVSFFNQKALVLYSNGHEILGLYYNDNKHTSKIYNLLTTENNPYRQFNNYWADAAVFGDKLFFVYSSNKHGSTGFDIWGRVVKLEDNGFYEEAFLPPVNDDVLYNNYPNPFNPDTKIAFQVYSPHHVKLAVYDMLGREVKVLVDEEMDRGTYEVNFDATGLSSGIYICRMEAFNTKTIKMIHVK